MVSSDEPDAHGAQRSSHRRQRRDLVSEAWRHLHDQRRMVVILSIVAVLAAQAESAALILIALAADAVARGSDQVRLPLGPTTVEPTVTIIALVTLAAIVAAAGLVLTYGWLEARVVAYLDRDARDRIVLSYAGADWEFQSTQKSARLQSRVRLMMARGHVFSGLVGWSRGLATILVFIAAAAIMSPFAALLIVGCALTLSVLVWPIRRSTRMHSRRMADAEVDLTEEFGDAVEQGPDVQIFGAWPAFIKKFAHRSAALERIRRRVGQLQALLPVVYQYGALAIIAVTMTAASLMETDGELGRFAASALLLLRSLGYGQMLQVSLHAIARFAPSVDKLERELQIPPPTVVPGRRPLDHIELLVLRNVEYSYPGTERPALREISLALRPGSIVGLAGPSGSGKSTLAQVLLRLRWPTAGEYQVNGRDAAEYSPESWNRLVSHVPQQPHLMHGSLYDNVTFFDESISRQRVLSALAAVGLDGLVEALPDGLDAPLGPTARSLSGGQIQRLAIARALVREPKLVILDEPTSALDTAAERLVADALVALRSRDDVLVVIIAHRPSTLALCNEIVVLHNGSVTAAGPGTRSEEVASVR